MLFLDLILLAGAWSFLGRSGLNYWLLGNGILLAVCAVVRAVRVSGSCRSEARRPVTVRSVRR